MKFYIENSSEQEDSEIAIEEVLEQISEVEAEEAAVLPELEKFYKPAPKKTREFGSPGVVLRADSRPAAKLPMFFRLSIQEQMSFTKRLAILLKAGVPILVALNMLKKQTGSKSSQVVMEDLARGVESGQFLYARLDRFRKFFGDFAVNLIKVGEISGTLHENLGYLAEELKKRHELRRKIVSALVYPVFIILATIGITALLTIYVFPKILPLLQSFKGELPLTTRALIFISGLFVSWGWLIALAALGSAALFSVLMKKSPRFHFAVDSLLLKLPVLGKLFRSYHMANFCRTLGVLIKTDVRIVEAVKIAAKISTNSVYQQSLLGLSESVTRGGKLSDYLERQGKLFSPMICQLITVGESTGKLTDTLLYLAEIYESEVDELTKNLSASIEPVLMIFMGLLVGFIAISIITPIYGITQSLHP